MTRKGRSAAALIVSLQLFQVALGAEVRMEAQFEHCCSLGSTWAAQGLKCEKFVGPVAGVLQVEQSLCLEAVDVCCVRSYRKKQCELGKNHARAGSACFTSSRPSSGDYQRDCCEGCKLGILTGSMGQGCAFKKFAFGDPWDPAFLECCHEAYQSTTADSTSTVDDGTSWSTTDDLSSRSTTSAVSPSSSFPASPKSAQDDLCQLMKGMLCSDICIPTPGSFICACNEGFTLLEDGKTCRQDSSVNRCKKDNPCEQHCTDTGEAIVCTCDPGFVLADDKHSCKPKSTDATPIDGEKEPRDSCPTGYRYNTSSQICTDIDECAEDQQICGNKVCHNRPGGYTCGPEPVAPRGRCGTGFKLSQNGCVDINECSETEDACDSNEQCLNTPGSFTCSCMTGFRRDNFTGACVDINECQIQEYDCLPSQRCDNTIGSYTCVRFLSCGTGYTLNAVYAICEDDDECALGTHDCGEGYHCRNTQGSYRCFKNSKFTTLPSRLQRPYVVPITTTRAPVLLRPSGVTPRTQIVCPLGFQASGAQCVDVNECESLPGVCSRRQKCVNTLGSYRCISRLICSSGYTLDASEQHCVDIDECAEESHACGRGQTCENRKGGYACKCPPGHISGPNNDCVDIDECSLYRNICGSLNSQCENTVGSYRCICNAGFDSVAGNTGCEDVNECQRNPGLCQHDCINFWGSYRCSCKPGYRLNSDNRSCSDIDECEEFKGSNLCVGICENTPGSYRCQCPNGYRLGTDGRTCLDIDECATERECRGPRETCQNIRGSFRCNRIDCPVGYNYDTEAKNRCMRISPYCQTGDQSCLRSPSYYSYNFMAIVSMMPLPPVGQLELFTLRSAHSSSTTVQFGMSMVDAKAPPGIVRATESCFKLRRPSRSQAILVLTQSIPGPQEIELDLSMEIYKDNYYVGSTIAKLFIIVSEYEF